MLNFSIEDSIGVIGSGAMGSGIAQIAASNGHKVVLVDTNPAALHKAKENLNKILVKLEEKGKISSATQILNNIRFSQTINDLKNTKLVIEAIIENLEIKKSVFQEIEKIVSENCVIASNTSSLSITSIAAGCQQPERVIGIHFFNPAPLMALVEVIPALQTTQALIQPIKHLLLQWGKQPVVVKDTPGFIVNRVARPFYSEALRIYEEGIANMATIDYAMTTIGGFKMGPFTLMDYIGHDVNYIVTETVFQSFFFDPRYKPSFTQKRLLEAGWLGRKSGRGFYNYAENVTIDQSSDKDNLSLLTQIADRIIHMLINEAVDALYLNIATKEDIDLAMIKGVNYPKGLLAWCDELGSDEVLASLDHLYHYYGEDRYRASPLLRRLGNTSSKLF